MLYDARDMDKSYHTIPAKCMLTALTLNSACVIMGESMRQNM